jgi:glycosyltransferase involved in cell wall biosynthesis
VVQTAPKRFETGDSTKLFPAETVIVISIVIPTYNRVSSLRKCIDSILPQFYEGLEIIIVDDASSDSTKQYLAELKQFSFIKVIRNCENRGVNYSRNRGIEEVTQKFILFLDSDDALSEQSLDQIRRGMKANSGTRHFLFIVSDRSDRFKHTVLPERVHYSDWVSGRFSGDFTHVVDSQMMKEYSFFEQFRFYEDLNWLRVLKATAPQLLIPIVTTQRERDRGDSLTAASKLQNISVIRSKFDSRKLHYLLYHSDLKLYSPKSFTYKLIESLMLGVACGQKDECRLLMHYASKPHIKLIANLVMTVPPFLLRYAIIKFSAFKKVSCPPLQTLTNQKLRNR